MSYDLAADGEDVTIKVFVNAPYDQFVTPETRFWNASGLDVSLGSDGLDVRTQSLVALLIGGVAFETPTFAASGEPATAGSSFKLYGERTTAMKQPETIARHYVVYFSESIRGLSAGAPVTLLGIPAGEITNVGVDLDPKTLTPRARVEAVAYPEHIVALLNAQQTATGEAIVRSKQQANAFFQRLVEEWGLRAQLRTGSLITGQRYVALDFFPDAPKAEIDWSTEIPEVPTVPSTLPDLEAKVTGILDKLDKIPYEAIGNDTRKTLETLDKALEHLDAGITPELKTSIVELRRVLATTDRVLKNTDATLLGTNAPGQLELRDALQEVARAARSVRVLSDYLERHPDALLRGKSAQKP
jgi:paraquat-inducible protein B